MSDCSGEAATAGDDCVAAVVSRLVKPTASMYQCITAQLTQQCTTRLEVRALRHHDHVSGQAYREAVMARARTRSARFLVHAKLPSWSCARLPCAEEGCFD